MEKVNAALLLRRPLLVTGWSGSGLSFPGYRVAHELQLDILTWQITRSTKLKDGLYIYDEKAHQHDVMLRSSSGLAGEQYSIARYLQLGPLGTALVPAAKPRVLIIDSVDNGTDEFVDDLFEILKHNVFEIPELAKTSEMEVNDVQTYDGMMVAIFRGRIQSTQPSVPFILLTSYGRRKLPLHVVSRCVLLRVPRPDVATWMQIIREQLGPEISEMISPKVLDAISYRHDLTVDQVIDAIYLASQSEILSLDEIERSLRDINTSEALGPDKTQDGQELDGRTDSKVTPVKETKCHIFLSYANGDSQLAGELKTEFERRGMRCFMATKDISVATEWEVPIREALISSTWVLLLLTPRSISRPWVLLESGAAWALGKRLVPALVQVSINDLIDPIRKYQARVIETIAQRQALIEELLGN